MSLSPSFAEFAEAYACKEAQLIYTVMPADLLTPVAALLRLRGAHPYHFLLESVEGGKSRGRYSIIGLDPDLIWKCENGQVTIRHVEESKAGQEQHAAEDAFSSLRRLIKESYIAIPKHLPPMAAGLFGYMGFDMVRLMEDLPPPPHKTDPLQIPDSIFIRPRIIIIFDSVKDEAMVVTPVWASEGQGAEAAYQAGEKRLAAVQELLNRQLPVKSAGAENHQVELTSHIDEAGYSKMVEKAKEYILAGDIFQVVPSRRLSAPFALDPLAFYRALRHLNPSPYLFYLHMADFVIAGSSPEILVSLQDGKVTIRPIAGTRKRGADRQEDASLAEDLLSDPKEISEHLMLLDLGRNDVGRVAKGGTVRVTEQMVIEYYSHVMHIVSNVEGMLREGLDAIDALIAGFPAGTVSGAPKIRAMEIIDELEVEKRSFYSGCVGYFSARGEMDTCITLRTALIKDGKIYLQAGGGVVADSKAHDEFVETTNKAAASKRAAEMAARFV